MHRLAVTLDAVKATRSRREKLALLASFFRTLDEDELVGAVRLIAGAPLAVGDPRAVGVGWALLLEVCAAATGRSEQELMHAARARGDLGEGLEPLWPAERTGLPRRVALPLFERLASAEERDAKRAVLTAALSTGHAAEAKYVVKALLGELRLGVQRSTLDDALALAFDVPGPTVRASSALTPDIGTLALLVKRGTLEHARLEPGRVVAFMLATPTEAVKEPLDAGRTVIEDKLDGVRAQAHVTPAGVTLFARGTGDVTSRFPDVVAQLSALEPTVVLDGEILAVKPDGAPRPFQALQARLGRAAPEASALRQTPVTFIAFDVLFDDEPLLSRPWSERRARLEALGVVVNPARPLDASRPIQPQLEEHFVAARARGHEGLMLKRTDAPYQAGQRGGAWRKVKRPLATLDVVITRAEPGHGKRAGVLSDYTFAVWRGEALVDIGKAYSGLTDAELAAMTQRLRAIAQGTEGRFVLVPPRVVLEVAFDGLQPSKRHASGFALRFPRIVRVRDDKEPKDADRLETVRALYEAQVRSGHREASAQTELF